MKSQKRSKALLRLCYKPDATYSLPTRSHYLHIITQSSQANHVNNITLHHKNGYQILLHILPTPTPLSHPSYQFSPVQSQLNSSYLTRILPLTSQPSLANLIPSFSRSFRLSLSLLPSHYYLQSYHTTPLLQTFTQPNRNRTLSHFISSSISFSSYHNTTSSSPHLPIIPPSQA